MITLYHFLTSFLITYLFEVFQLHDIRLYLMQFSMYNQCLNTDNKIEKTNLLIQVSAYSWMIRLTAVSFFDFDLE